MAWRAVAERHYAISGGVPAEGTFGSVSKPLRYLLYKPAIYFKLDVDGSFKKMKLSNKKPFINKFFFNFFFSMVRGQVMFHTLSMIDNPESCLR